MLSQAHLGLESLTDFLEETPLFSFLTMEPVAFKVYDMDRDGFISNGELFLVLKMMVGSNLKVRRFWI